jgi:NADH-quinone oxidoreductase subunit C
MTLADHIPGAAHAISSDGIENVLVSKDGWLDAARALANEHGFGRFIDLTIVDHLDGDARFEVLLLLYSMAELRWTRLKAKTSGNIASVCSAFAGAHNYEREAFDLFGVVFEGHPRLTRIMMPDGWQGHPLRRDEDIRVEPTDFTVTRALYRT